MEEGVVDKQIKNRTFDQVTVVWVPYENKVIVSFTNVYLCDLLALFQIAYFCTKHLIFECVDVHSEKYPKM